MRRSRGQWCKDLVNLLFSLQFTLWHSCIFLLYISLPLPILKRKWRINILPLTLQSFHLQYPWALSMIQEVKILARGLSLRKGRYLPLISSTAFSKLLTGCLTKATFSSDICRMVLAYDPIQNPFIFTLYQLTLSVLV